MTPEFDHRDSGTPAAVWAADPRFERAAPLDLADSGSWWYSPHIRTTKPSAPVG